MARYDYKCINEKCDIHNIIFEVERSMKADSLTTCPDCNKETLQQVITGAPAFRSVVNGLNRFRPATSTKK